MAVAVLAEERGGFTAFGWHIRELMSRKRIAGQKELSEVLTANGYPITQPGVSKVLRGKSEPSRRFVSVLADSLQLNERERSALSDMYTYERLTDENYRRIEELDREIEEDEGPDGG